ncbi:unnamed protein product [Mytilus edulis]|uniref:Uncharacterized protein n=1 Tax=Mytilus edulis TaxID=6550 RepID=A0A8S3R122_MYTED|nr:unnamed protein product [Mytilus edulis]
MNMLFTGMDPLYLQQKATILTVVLTNSPISMVDYLQLQLEVDPLSDIHNDDGIYAKVVKEEATSLKTLSKTQEKVDYKAITLRDDSGEIKLSLWRQYASLSLSVGELYYIANVKTHVYNNEMSLNNTFNTKLEVREAPVRSVNVIVDGYYIEHNHIVLRPEDEKKIYYHNEHYDGMTIGFKKFIHVGKLLSNASELQVTVSSNSEGKIEVSAFEEDEFAVGEIFFTGFKVFILPIYRIILDLNQSPKTKDTMATCNAEMGKACPDENSYQRFQE